MRPCGPCLPGLPQLLLMAADYSSDEGDMRGDLSMDPEYDFGMPAGCSMQARTFLPNVGGEPKKRGKGEGGRAGAAPKPPKEVGSSSGRPPLDIHTAGLVGGDGGAGALSPTLGADGRILCRICGDSAVRHVHYGGHCCFSCKAFFR